MRIIRYVIMLLMVLVWSVAHAAERVNIHVVLALDCSDSVSAARWRAQLRGYSHALQNPDVIAAIAPGVAISVVVWSGPDEQTQAIPWFRVHDRASALALALVIEQIPQIYNGYTNIGSGIDFSVRLIEHADPTRMTKRIIDISGDGQHRESAYPNTRHGVPLETARARASAADVLVNGLPIEGDEGGIADYYREKVIVGDGAFIESVKDPDDTDAFARAIRKKLLRELLASTR